MGTVGTGEGAGAGAITTAGGGRGRGTRGGVAACRAAGRQVPPGSKSQSTAGGAVPVATSIHQRVRVEMRPEDGETVRGAGLPSSDHDTAV